MALAQKLSICLYENNLINNFSDIYDLSYNDLIPLERIAEKSASNLIKSIDASKAVPFERVLFSLGIRHVGETVAKKLAKYFKTIDRLMLATLEELVEVDEIGDKIAVSLIEYFNNDKQKLVINNLINHGLNFTIVEEDQNSDCL